MIMEVFLNHMHRIQKSAFGKTFAVTDMVQQLSEIWYAMLLEKSRWVPAEGVQFTDEWIRLLKQRRLALKLFVDEIFDKVFLDYRSLLSRHPGHFSPFSPPIVSGEEGRDEKAVPG
jgi:hypothetical protein